MEQSCRNAAIASAPLFSTSLNLGQDQVCSQTCPNDVQLFPDQILVTLAPIVCWPPGPDQSKNGDLIRPIG